MTLITGPEMYSQGVLYLEHAKNDMAVSSGRTVELAAIAQACFAGAQAAALGGLAADESKSPALREAWSAAIGDAADEVKA